MKAVVVGGGLGGLITTLDLLDHGVAVELIEQQDRLGGGLASSVDVDGDPIEQRLRWYSRGDTTLLGLLERYGLAERIRWPAHGLAVARPGGATSHVPLPMLPPPLNALAASLTNDLLTLPEKLLTTVGLLSSAIGSDEYVASLDSVSYARWHREHRVPRRVLTRLIDPLARSLGWLPADQLSARPLVALFRHLASNPAAGQLGTLDGPSGPRLIDPLAALAAANGARLHLGTRACEIMLAEGGVAGVRLEGGETAVGDAYVLAVQPDALRCLVPEGLRAVAPFAGLRRVEMAPTLSVQLWLDRYVHYSEHFYLTADACFSAFGDLALTSPIQYDRHGGSVVAMALAPAAPYWPLPDDEIVARCRGDLQRLWPGVRGARLLKSAVVRSPGALYRAAPGAAQHLRGGPTPVANLFLAGDWTASPSFPSLEGAARSGLRASALVRSMV